MYKISFSVLVLSSFLFIDFTYSHGENLPGPNGGTIRMLGTFHTELVRVKDDTFNIYLLDINFKNPTVSNSNVEVFLVGEKLDKKIICKSVKAKKLFECDISNVKEIGKIKEIKVTATRDRVKYSNEAIYHLPLK
ncbi:MAG: hypothetical protein QE271_00040 [Bacteriovoracaceae bacterium]|nr:hypothetical protein [Bacteriovoracaceae bacterium]